MKSFFYKKYFFAALFLILLLLFSGANVFFGWGEIEELGEAFEEVEHIGQLGAWIDEAEEEADEELFGREAFTEGYGWLQKLFGKKEFNHFTYIRDTDGMMYYGSLYQGSNHDLEQYVGNIRRLKRAVEAKGARLIVVLPPAKLLPGVNKADSKLLVSNPNARMDKFLNLMMQNDIFAVDLRTAMQKSGEKPEALFFRTDHQWTPLAAFYAVRELVGQVETEYGDNWDIEGYYTNLENYHSRVYEEAMLGSFGRGAGSIYSGREDFLLLWPECDMEFSWTDHKNKKEQKGSFEEAFFVSSALQEAVTGQKDINAVYLDKASDHDRIVNYSNEEGPRLAVLRDQYFSPMACFLAPMCSEIEMVWNKRSYNQIDYEAFVQESDADYVILEVYPYNLTGDSFDFFKN